MSDNRDVREKAEAPASVRNGTPGNGKASSPNGAATVNVKQLLMAIVLVAGFAELAYVVVNISAMPVYIKSIRLDLRWISVVTTVYLIAEGVMKSPFGLLGDRFGRKKLILIGPVVSTVTALLTPLFHNPYALVGLRLLDGIGAAALWPSAFSLIGDYVPENRRASAMSLFNIAYILGIALGPALGGNANDWAHENLHLSLEASKHISFYLAAVLFAITAIVALVFVPNVRVVHHDPADLGPGVEGGFSFTDFKRMLGRMPTMLLMAFVTFLGIGLIMAYVKVFAMDRHGPFGLTESQFGNYLIIPALVIASLSLPLGNMVDRFGKARAVRLGIGVCSVSFWLLIFFPATWTLLFFGSLIGLGFIVAFPAWMALVSADCEPNQRGAAVGAVGTAQGLGAIFGVAASGFLYKQPAIALGVTSIPSHGLPFLGCALMLTVSFLLAVTSIRERPCPVA